MTLNNKDGSKKSNLCRQCKHYYITWDPKYPHGCRGFNMKSKQSPALVVQSSSGKSCLMFEKKSIYNSKVKK